MWDCGWKHHVLSDCLTHMTKESYMRSLLKYLREGLLDQASFHCSIVYMWDQSWAKSLNAAKDRNIGAREYMRKRCRRAWYIKCVLTEKQEELGYGSKEIWQQDRKSSCWTLLTNMLYDRVCSVSVSRNVVVEKDEEYMLREASNRGLSIPRYDVSMSAFRTYRGYYQ